MVRITVWCMAIVSVQHGGNTQRNWQTWANKARHLVTFLWIIVNVTMHMLHE